MSEKRLPEKNQGFKKRDKPYNFIDISEEENKNENRSNNEVNFLD